MATTVGSVNVKLRARIETLEKDLAKAKIATKKSADGMQRSFGGVTKSIGAMRAGIVAAASALTALVFGRIANLSREAIRTADEIGDVASKLGVSTSALQEFQFAAIQSGVTVEQLNMGLQRFARRAAEAAAGTGEARDAIKQLGLELRDANGNMRTTEDLFGDVMKKLGEIEDPLVGLRLAFKLFDSEGVALVNMAGNMDELREKAVDLGVVMSDDLIARAGELQDSFDALSKVTKTALSRALIDIGENALLPMAQWFADAAKEANAFYLTLVKLDGLGKESLAMRLTEQESEIADLEARLAALRQEEAEHGTRRLPFGSGVGFGEIELLEGRLQSVRREAGATREALGRALGLIPDLEGGGPTEIPTRTGGVTAPTDTTGTVADEERAARTAEQIRERAHRKYLELTGQRRRLLAEERDAQLAALEAGTEAHADNWRARLEIETNYNLQVAKLREEEEEALQKLRDEQLAEWAGLYDFMEDGFSDALATMLLDGEFTFKQLGEAFLREFVQRGIKQGLDEFDVIGGIGRVFGTIGSALGFGDGLSVPIGASSADAAAAFDRRFSAGTIPSPAPVPKFARGGAVHSGPILVGERGPELFMPGKSGFVASNYELSKVGARGGGEVTVTVINNSSESATTTERDGPNGSRNIEVMIGSAVSKDIQRGGAVDQAIRDAYGMQRVGRHGI